MLNLFTCFEVFMPIRQYTIKRREMVIRYSVLNVGRLTDLLRGSIIVTRGYKSRLSIITRVTGR